MTHRLACAGLAVFLAVGCRKLPAHAAGSTRAPKGDAIWLADSAAAGEPGLEDSLQRIGAAALFLPAGEVKFESGLWVLREDPHPPHRVERASVVLVLRAGPELSGAFQSADGTDPAAMARALGASLGRPMGSGGPYGRVIGVHLDFPFSAAGASRYGAFVDAVRPALPPGTFVSITLHAPPSAESERKKLQPALQAADAVLAFVFRDGERAEPAALDALRRPWWAAFGTASHGVRTAPDGRAVEGVAEKFLDPLSGNPRVDLENDLSENDAAVSAFHMLVRGPVRLEGLSLDPGDRIAFRVPSQTELLYQLGSVLAGKRFALGRVIVFEGASDAERILPIAAFEDVLLGRSLSPDLEVIAEPRGRNTVTVEATNRSALASIVSRVSNWVEVDLAPARPADVQLGGFDRYEVYDTSGRPVTLGRATRVRFFETLIGPREAISPARIVVRGALPKACCPHRLHAIAAAGPEVASEWTSPPPPPTPAPKAKTRRKP